MFELNDYRFKKTHRIESGLSIGLAFRRNACILQPVFNAIQKHNSAYSADIVYDIFAIQDELQEWDDTDFIGGKFIDAMGVRELGVDTLSEYTLMNNHFHEDYSGGIFVFRVEYDAERKITYLILDEYERKEENHAKD